MAKKSAWPVTPVPEYYKKCENGKFLDLEHEEEVVVWLWAFPSSNSLLPWDKDIAWLLSPVTGKEFYPGDAWGVDEEGNLLIVECKKQNPRKSREIKDDKYENPFYDFLPFHEKDLPQFKSEKLKEKWKDLYKKEKDFKNSWIERGKKTPGIIPRSNKREAIRRWKALCIDKIDDYIRNKEKEKYEEKAYKYLKIRESARNPLPHYFGIIATTLEEKDLDVSEISGLMNDLKNKVGEKNVHLCFARAKKINSEIVELSIEF